MLKYRTAKKNALIWFGWFWSIFYQIDFLQICLLYTHTKDLVLEHIPFLFDPLPVFFSRD